MNASRFRRGFAAFAMLASAALVLSGCLYSAIPAASPSSSHTSPAPVIDGAPAGLESFYGQKVSWKSCGGSYDCATVKVPLDYSNPDKRSIDIAMKRQRASGSDRVGSLLINPGGPGGSGISMLDSGAAATVGRELPKHFDIVGIDPRGVGQSTAVKCLDAKGMDHYYFDHIDAPRDSDEWQKIADQKAADYAKACEANSDGILQFITTQNSARDFDVIRAALGDEKMHYLGFSYGTFLGATYAELFPQRVGSLVLDGAMDPSIPGTDVGAIQSKGFEDAIRAYMKDCLSKSDCPFSGTVDQALGDVTALLKTVDASPMANADGRKLDGSVLLQAIITAMYSQDTWPYLTSAFTQVQQGDPRTAFLLADAYYGRNADGTYSDNSDPAFNAYNCMDYPDEGDEAAVKAADEEARKNAPTFAGFWGGGDVCASWPFPPSGERKKLTAEGAGPIVVVGTTNDPATPYAWAVSLSKQLSSGVLITRDGEGHTGFNKGNTCVDKAVEGYLIKGKVPQNGLTC